MKPEATTSSHATPALRDAVPETTRVSALDELFHAPVQDVEPHVPAVVVTAMAPVEPAKPGSVSTTESPTATAPLDAKR